MGRCGVFGRRAEDAVDVATVGVGGTKLGMRRRVIAYAKQGAEAAIGACPGLNVEVLALEGPQLLQPQTNSKY